MQESTASQPAPLARGADRRRTPRLQVDGLLAAFMVSQKARMDVKDLSFGGFAAETEAVLQKGETHEVSFLPPLGENVVLSVRVAYAQRLSGPDQPTRYFGGFEFLHTSAHSRPAVNRLMIRVAALLGFGNGPASNRQS